MSILEKTRFSYCPHCGKQNIIGQKNAMICNSCGYKLFFNCAAATSCLILRNNHLLMVVRKKDPGKGLLDLPGGFVDYGESLEEGMGRELMEEIGVTPENLAYHCSAPNTYVYKDVTYRTTDCFFTATLPKDARPVAGDDAESLRWVKLDEIDFNKIAFDSAKFAIRKYLSSK
ncbi:MAG: NUDIX domain-containing protein [Eubacteriales bacterium]